VKLPIKTIILSLIATISGLVVLIGYFTSPNGLSAVRQVILQWAVILFAVALIAGVINLSRAHLSKVTAGQKGWPFSLALLIALGSTLLIGLVYTPTGRPTQWIFNFIQLPVETSLMAVLAVILTYICARLLSRRLNLFSILFIGAVLLVLLATMTYFQPKIQALNTIYTWVTQVWVVGGVRGFLIGIALGIIATGLRAILSIDRPYER